MGEKRTRTTRRDEAMVGEFDVNQEADDLEDEGELEEYQEDVCYNRTGELLDAKLTMRAENEVMTYMEQLEVGIESTEEECMSKDGESSRDHQVGSREQGNIVKGLDQSQARGERLQDERRRTLVCGHAAT